MNARIWMVVAALGMLVGTAACEQPAGDEQVSLTVYNGNFGVVRELRRLTIGKSGGVKFTDVAAAIDPTTVHFRSTTDPNAKLLEQNYQYDLVSADRLLQKYIDQRIEVVAEGMTYAGELLSFDGRQLVLRTGEGLTMIQRPDNVRDIRFGALPEGLITRPTLIWLVATRKSGEHLAEVTYQTGKINWHAEYVLVLGDGDAKADLSGWVSVDNRSGKTYRDARLKFIAGDVRRIEPPRPRAARAMAYGAAEMADAAMVEKAFFEYHMYTLPRPSTVADNETKQLEMFAPVRGLKVAKRFLYNPLGEFRWGYGGRYTDRSYGASQASRKVNVFIEFRNSDANQLGIPLPAGKVRVFKQDPDDEALEFIGEEKIDHTPKDEELSLRIGNAFDIVGERKQVSFRVETGRKWMQEKLEIRVRNHKEEAAVVRVKEPLYRWINWDITAESAEHIKLDSKTAAWDLNVPAEGEVVLTYTVEYTW